MKNFIPTLTWKVTLTFPLRQIQIKVEQSFIQKNIFDVTERLDLNVCHELYESTWIEIKNKKNKNVICGSIYRHPNNNIMAYEKFLGYLELCFVEVQDA